MFKTTMARRRLGSGGQEVRDRLLFWHDSSKSDFWMGKSDGLDPREEIAAGRCSRFKV